VRTGQEKAKHLPGVAENTRSCGAPSVEHRRGGIMDSLLKLLADIEALAADRPLATPEIHEPNDYYGHAAVLKRYAGWPGEQAVKAVIEHSFAMFPQYVWDVDMQAELPGILVFSAERREYLRSVTTRRVEAVGPLISYAEPLVSLEEIEALRGELGRVLLAFPVHSTHHINADYNINLFCTEVLRMGREYDRVLVCLGWKDVLRGFGELYAAYGLTCVTAGHMYDPEFLPRLRTIISLSEMTVSSNFSSHVGYCILLGKPHALIDTDISFIAPSASIYQRDAVCMDAIKHQLDTPYFIEMLKPFQTYSTTITEEQTAVIHRCFGQDCLMTKEEMFALLDDFERAFVDQKQGIR